MKKHIAGILVILSLGAFSWAQGTKDLFDAKKSKEELEIMSGILRTTLTFVTRSGQKQASSSWQFSNISAFYLAGQGAVFMIPTSGFRTSNLAGFSGAFDRTLVMIAQERDKIKAESERLALEAFRLSSGTGEGAGAGVGRGVGTGTGGNAAVAPPAPPSPPSPPQMKLEELYKKVEEYQAKAKKSREEAEEGREKFLKSLAEIKVYLIEALANYGDSLTTVKPGEYINLVLATNDNDGIIVIGPGQQRAQHDVISAQKSWITDYKAGRLSLDNFKQKVLQYSE
jgi:hypothetical protein